MQDSLETARTLLRPFRPSDAEAAFGWLGDPEVMRHIPLGQDATVRDSEARIARYLAHETAHGFSKWIVLDRNSGIPIGDSGFFQLPGEGNRVELGYRLARASWGRGLATEIAARWLEVAAPWYGFSRVHAFALPDNAASLSVLKKLGFSFSHQEMIYGVHAPMYARDLVVPA